MDSQRYADDLDSIRRVLKRQQIIAIVLGVALVLALIQSFSQFGRERTVVVPPTIERGFWITASTASTEYIEQMSLWIASLILDVTPSNGAYKSGMLLQFVDPSAHGALKEAGELSLQRLRRDSASTLFDLETIRTDVERLAALMTGKLNTFINGQLVSTTTKHYLVRYRLSAGRASVIEFSEVPHGDINAALKER